MLGTLLTGKIDVSVRKGFLLYKKLICPLIYYACHAWRYAARIHVRRLQVLLYNCLCLTTGVPWYISNRHIHEDLGVRCLTTTSDS